MELHENGSNSGEYTYTEDPTSRDDDTFQCHDGSNEVPMHNVCDGFDHCYDGSDEENCGDPVISFSGTALTGLILAASLMLLIIIIQLCIHLHRYRIKHRSNRDRQDRINQLRTQLSRHSSTNTAPGTPTVASMDPPDYWACMQNAGYIDEDGTMSTKSFDSKPPSYENYVCGDFVKLGIPPPIYKQQMSLLSQASLNVVMTSSTAGEYPTMSSANTGESRNVSRQNSVMQQQLSVDGQQHQQQQQQHVHSISDVTSPAHVIIRSPSRDVTHVSVHRSNSTHNTSPNRTTNTQDVALDLEISHI